MDEQERERKLELQIQKDLADFLRARGWLVERMLADAFQNGIPDLYIHHPKWGSRWVEVKRPDNYSFTRAQRRKWPEWEKSGVPIWILTAATDEQYGLLFGPPNWRKYWRPSYQIPDVDAMIDELVREHEAEQNPSV